MTDIMKAAEQAMAQLKAGDPMQAVQLIAPILTESGDHPLLLNILGLAYDDIGETDKALQHFESAAARKPDYFNAFFNLGRLLQRMGREEEAITAFDSALKVKPDYVDALVGRGNVYAAQHAYEKAKADYEKAISLDPDSRDAVLNLGNVLQETNDYGKAEQRYLKALELSPGEAGIYFNLGRLYFSQARYGEATVQYRRAVRLDPTSATHCRGLASCFEIMPIDRFDAELKADLMACMACDGVEAEHLMPAAIKLLKLDPVFSAVLQSAMTVPLPKQEDEVLPLRELAGIDDPLLSVLLRTAPLADADIEHLLTHVRASVLAVAGAGLGKPLENTLEFLGAVSEQCFLTEYAWWSEPWEETALDGLLEDSLVEDGLVNDGGEPDRVALMAHCLYRPLSSLALRNSAFADADLAAYGPEFHVLIRQQLEEPAEELHLASSMPELTAIAAGTSKDVKDQYEENPYPRWRMMTPLLSATPQAIMEDLFPESEADFSELATEPDILIAGCGTGMHAFHAATRFIDAKVTAIDLSRTSLGFAARKANELKISNVEFGIADILALGDWPERYDIIESIGTLVAMDDPLAAWQILTDMLKPGGLMKIGLYSETARQGIVAARAFVADGGYTADKDEIRRCRHDMHALPPDHPARTPMRSADFFSISGTRDLIFHVKEIRFTIREIAEMLDKLELEFLGFEIRGPDILDAYNEMFPDDPSAQNLENWHQFEQANPRSFAEMYQFWLQKKS